MNRQEWFRKYLLGEYRPPVEVGNDGQGGYLVPSRLMVDKSGMINKFYRYLGYLIKSNKIYEMGTKIINPQEEILRSIEEMKISKQELDG